MLKRKAVHAAVVAAVVAAGVTAAAPAHACEPWDCPNNSEDPGPADHMWYGPSWWGYGGYYSPGWYGGHWWRGGNWYGRWS